MPTKKKIAKNAIVKNSNFESEQITIGDGAKVTDVFIKAKKLIIKSNARLTGCKLFSDGIVMVGKETIIKEHTIINAFK